MLAWSFERIACLHTIIVIFSYANGIKTLEVKIYGVVALVLVNVVHMR
jgi:hypothetical protein